MTKSSANKDELDSAREFNEDNEILNKVKELKNNDLKESLEKKLDEIIGLLEDKTAPLVNIEDGAILDSYTEIEVEDDNEVTLLLNGTEIENEHEVQDGEYELVVTDAAFNEVTIKFIVDTKAPEGTVIYSIEELTNKDVVVTLEVNEDVEVTNNDGLFEYTFEENGEFTFEFKDIAGNKGTAKAVVNYIDKELPEATVTYSTEDFINGNVIITIALSEEVREVEGFTLSENKKELTKELSANETKTITVEDLAGNKTEVTYSVTNIDKEPPRVSGVEEDKYYKEATPIVEDENIESIKINGVSFVSGKTIKINGTFTLVATDKAGNETSVTFTIDNIDPKILVLDRLSVIRGDLIPIKPVIIDANLDKVIITLDGEDINYKDGDQLVEPGLYEITAIDKTGNTSITTFTMDNNGPEIYTEQEVLGSKVDVKLSGLSLGQLLAFSEVKLKLKEDNFDPKSIIVLRKSNIDLPFDFSLPTYNKIDYTYGDTITMEGEYIVLAADKALNISYAKFTIDRTKPVIVGVENGKYYDEVEVKVEDANLALTVVSKKVLGFYIPTLLTNGDVITESGEYKIEATDKAGNNADPVEFIVDHEDPTIEGVINNYVYTKEVAPVVKDANLDSVVITKDGDIIESQTKYAEDGVYIITATDKANNKTTVTFEINKNALKIEGVENNTHYNNAVTPEITDIGQNTTVTLTKDGSVVDYTSTISLEGEYILKVVDEYNNEVVVNFVIDTTAATIYAESKQVPASKDSFISVEAIVEDNIDEDKTIVPVEINHTSLKTVTLVDNKISTSKDWLGTYTLVYKTTDKAGNESEEIITIEVLRSDIVIVFDDTNVTTSTYSASDKLSTITAHLEDDENNLVASNDGDIIFTVTDLNGNPTTLENAGKYIITANVNKETTGYQYVLPVTMNYEITPIEVTIEYSIVNDEVNEDNTYEYDQKVKTYVAKINEVDGYKTIGEYSTSSANVGEYILDATKDYSNSNYKLVGENTLKVIIEKASLRVDFPLTANDINADGTVTPVFKHLNILSDDVLVNIPYTIKYEKVTRNISWSGITTTYEEKTSMTEKGEYKVTVTVDETTNYQLSSLGSTWTYVIF